MKSTNYNVAMRVLALVALFVGTVVGSAHGVQALIEQSDEQIEELVRRSYQYVAM